MEAALHVLEIAVGILVVAATLGSAIKTVVITRVVFLVMRRVYLVLAPPSAPYERRDRVLASYAPVSLVAVLVAWLALVFGGYVLLFMGAEGLGVLDAAELSGSSLFTPGIARPDTVGGTLLVFTEAALGLFLLALLITSYLEDACVPIKPDREQAWRDSAGWRVNYDTALLGLANITTAPDAPWSSDRAGDRTLRVRAAVERR